MNKIYWQNATDSYIPQPQQPPDSFKEHLGPESSTQPIFIRLLELEPKGAK